ncbi:MAG TPA: ribosome maturation factor RimP [Gemmatimonadaceae bacterium]|nr:ribosome maturation factor RimP [Gemmatimonadaceae bacterium]
MNDVLQTLVESELDALGLDLVEIRRGGSKGRPTLDVRIDRRDGGKVTVDDCATASRALEARLDAEHSLGDRYVLEVSSPGVERPLRKPADWRRFAGRRASVLAEALGGRVEVEIVGVEDDASGAAAVVRTSRGEERRIPLAEVKEARLAFTW